MSQKTPITSAVCSIIPSSLRGYAYHLSTITFVWSISKPPLPLTFRVVVRWGDGVTDAIDTDRYEGSYTTSHMYASPGYYYIRAHIVHMRYGMPGDILCESTALAEIANPLSISSFTANPSSGVAPLNVRFDGKIDGGYDPISWMLNFGDGRQTSGSGRTVSVSYKYNNPGTYTATLIAQDALGAYTCAEIPSVSPRSRNPRLKVYRVMEVIR